MAEILLSLTIIGVVAAITLPSLTGNINERTWNTQRKALYARVSQAISLMPSLNGYGNFGGVGSGSAATADTAAETFLTAGLSKVLKINNICDADHLSDCGVPATINQLSGGGANSVPTQLRGLGSPFFNTAASALVPNTRAAAFETANGETVITYYNPYCVGEGVDGEPGSFYAWGRTPCVNFIYDLNGAKGPNTFSKDIGIITVFFSTDSMVVAPMPLAMDSNYVSSHQAAVQYCRSQGDDVRLPNIYELDAIILNSAIIGGFGDDYYVSSSTILHPGGRVVYLALSQDFSNITVDVDSIGGSVRCVKR